MNLWLGAAVLLAEAYGRMVWLNAEPEGRFVEYWDSHGYPRDCQPVDGPDGRHLSFPAQP